MEKRNLLLVIGIIVSAIVVTFFGYYLYNLPGRSEENLPILHIILICLLIFLISAIGGWYKFRWYGKDYDKWILKKKK